jgi:hypothetical protein
VKNTDITDILAVITLFIVIVGVNYLLFVGIFALINAAFGTSINIWLGGLIGLLVSTIIRN